MGKAALRKKRLKGGPSSGNYAFGAPSDLSRGYSRSSVALRVFAQRCDVREVAIALVVVEPVADREPVRDLEADVANRQVHTPSLRLGQQRADLERGRLARLQVA